MLKLHTLGTIDLRTSEAALLSVLHRPKHIALLTYLALARPTGYHRRDVLVALLWPELDAERARAALRKVLHGLRQSLGPEVLLRRGDEEIALAPGHVWCDAVEFEARSNGGDAGAALALYGGPLLPGLHMAGAPEFEQWLERERERLRRLARDTAWRAAESAEQSGNAAAALAFGQRALELAGCDDVAMRRLLALHERVGDPVGGLAAFESYRARLAAELEMSPGAETVRAADALRARLEMSEPVRPPAAHRVSEATSPPAIPMAAPPAPRFRRFRRTLTAALVLGLAVLAGTWLRAPRGSAAVRPVLAVGAVHDLTGDSASSTAAALPDLLATNLARAPGLQVISTARMYELLGATGLRGNAVGAARRAGATELIEGALHRGAGGMLRLDLRRVDLQTGSVRSAVSVEGAALFDVVDRATARLTEALGTDEPDLRVADVTTASPAAFGYYQHGVQAYYTRANGPLAYGFFAAALETDSTFAMAAYYAALSAPDYPQRRALLARAVRLSASATERERLLIGAQWADEMNQPARLAIAESLAVRFPTDPDGHYLRGRALVWNGDFLAAVPHLRRVLAMDSAAPTTPRCRACDALSALTLAYLLADSIDAAQAAAEQWLRWRPESANAWDALANTREAAGRPRDALAARQRQDALSPSADYPKVYPAVLAIRAGDFAHADNLLEAQVAHGSISVAQLAAWYEVISLRYQGRLEAAWQVVRRLEGERSSPGELAALVLQESGRGREAAAIFGARAAAHADAAARADAWAARDLVFSLTRQADALAESGDTAGLLDLAGRIREIAPASGYGRDRRLYHHVLGRWHAARGEHARAVAEFRQAIFSPTAGYTRTNAQLARSLLALGRPGEAIPVLQAAFRNSGLQASTLYVTHAELHELLGYAFAAAGHADSARVHLRWTADAWRRADPLLQPRREAVERRLRALH